jgi:hypothetical protein
MEISGMGSFSFKRRFPGLPISTFMGVGFRATATHQQSPSIDSRCSAASKLFVKMRSEGPGATGLVVDQRAYRLGEIRMF